MRRTLLALVLSASMITTGCTTLQTIKREHWDEADFGHRIVTVGLVCAFALLTYRGFFYDDGHRGTCDPNSMTCSRPPSCPISDPSYPNCSP